MIFFPVSFCENFAPWQTKVIDFIHFLTRFLFYAGAVVVPEPSQGLAPKYNQQPILDNTV